MWRVGGVRVSGPCFCRCRPSNTLTDPLPVGWVAAVRRVNNAFCHAPQIRAPHLQVSLGVPVAVKNDHRVSASEINALLEGVRKGNQNPPPPPIAPHTPTTHETASASREQKHGDADVAVELVDEPLARIHGCTAVKAQPARVAQCHPATWCRVERCDENVQHAFELTEDGDAAPLELWERVGGVG